MCALRRPVVSAVFLGRLGYLPCLDIQEQLARRHLDWLAGTHQSPAEDTLIIVEHPPVYTVGKREKQYTVGEEENLKKLGAEFYRTKRGGLITFHGPGQLVAYPILNLANFTKGMRWYVGALEQTLIDLCSSYNITAGTTRDTGVWVMDNKIAAIGVHARRFITSHGIALNCNTDLAWYDHITPCGIVNKGVTSLTHELGQDVCVEDAVQPFVDAFSDQFNCDITWTDDSLVKRIVNDVER